MDGPTLSGWEKRILTEIESDLRADQRLDHELSTMRRAGWHRVDDVLAGIAHVPLAVVALLATVSAALVPIGLRVGSAHLLLLFALVWVPSLALLLVRAGHGLIARRQAKRARTSAGRPPPYC
jgi:hypothetical protein